jgi:uncharacterized protein YfaS (alpha-2-macroglobulin family)
MPTHRATAMGMLSVLREQAGDLSTALHWFDQWVKATTSLDTPEAVLSAELRRLRLVDPERQQPETLRRLRELWNDPRFTSLPDVAAVAQPLIEAQFIQGQPHAGLDTAVEPCTGWTSSVNSGGSLPDRCRSRRTSTRRRKSPEGWRSPNAPH